MTVKQVYLIIDVKESAFARMAATAVRRPHDIIEIHNLTLESIPALRLPNVTSGKRHNRVFRATNPSIVLLPAHHRAALGATYAAAMRVSNHNNCFKVTTPAPTPCLVLLGLRLLGANLEPLPDREVVVHCQ